ncbi:MAG: glutamate--tRNA ligase, partial [Planctomycetota bacterium]
MSESVRVRFAPSPTGKLHVGGARTALFNWAFAKRQGGTFLLRIEDTDEERSTKEFEVAILEGLRWLGIDWDEGPDAGGEHGPYYQSERRGRHDAIAAELFERGLAYRCFCTSEELATMREERMAKGLPAYDGRYRDLSREESDARAAAGDAFTLRFRVPDGVTNFTDLIRGDVRFENKEVEDWVMVRTTGAPTYNFVVVCDDADMEITHVLRGEEHLTNTPKQILLFEALGKKAPQYAHLPLMLGKDKKKLSKRTGDTALQDYREKGFPKDAIVNFLCLQGWALDGETEVFSVEELATNFEIGDVSKGGAVFDIEKFEWLAGEWIRRESVEELAAHCAPHVVAAGQRTEDQLGAQKEWFHSVVKEMQERLRTYAELPAKIAFLFAGEDEVVWEEKAEKNA